MRTLHLLLAMSLLTLVSGCKWEVDAECTGCPGTVKVTGYGCSYSEAYDDAQSKCPYDSAFNETDSQFIPSTECIHPPVSSVSVAQIQSFATDVVQAYTKKPGAQPAADGPTCGTVEPFTLVFTNNYTSNCDPQDPVQWTFYLNNVEVASGAVQPGEEISQLIDPTGDVKNADDDGDGFYDGEYLFRFSSTSNIPGFGCQDISGGDGYGQKTVPLGSTMHFTVNEDFSVTGEIIPKAKDSQLAKAIRNFAAPLVTALPLLNSAAATEKPSSPAKSDLVPKPDPKFSKRAK